MQIFAAGSNALSIIRIQFRAYRREKGKTLIGVLMLTLFLILMLSSVFGALYYFYITSPDPIDRNLFDTFNYLHLLAFSIIFYYGGINTISGMIHPLITNRQVGLILTRTPLDNQTLFTYTLVLNVVKSLLYSLFYFLVFVPIMVIGKLPWYNLILGFISCILGSIQLLLMFYLLFFIVEPIRRKIKTIDFLYDTSSPVMTVVMLWPIIIGFISIINDFIPSFDLISSFYYLPVVNFSISFSGMFLRAGIPSVSIFALISMLVVIVSLLSINLILAENYESLDELETTISKYLTALSYQKQMQGGTPRKFEILSRVSSGSFIHSPPLFSLLYKDWLALKRTKDGNKHLYSLLFMIPISWFVLPVIENNTLYFTIIMFMTYLAVNCQQILMSIETSQITHSGIISAKQIRYSKILGFILINLFSFSPLWLINAPLVIFGSFIAGIIIGSLYNTQILQSQQGIFLLVSINLISMLPVVFFVN